MPSKEPSRTKLRSTAIATQSAALQKLPKELLDQIVADGPMAGEQINATTMALKKALIEGGLGWRAVASPGYPPGEARPEDAAAKQRIGRSAKTVCTDGGPLRIEVPRDREGSFEPLLIGKHERRFTGFANKIITYICTRNDRARHPGLSGRTVRHRDHPGVSRSVNDAAMAEVTVWQAHPLEPMYPVVFFRALRFKIREDAVVRNKTIYLTLSVLPEGTRDILGL